MKKFNFSTKEIAKWYEERREPFKKYGKISELLIDLGISKNETLAGEQNNDGEGWIILRNFDSLELRKTYHEIQKEHKILCSINWNLLLIEEQEEKLKNSLTPDDFEEKEDVLNELYDKLLSDWKSLTKNTQNNFHSKKIQHLLDTNWYNEFQIIETTGFELDENLRFKKEKIKIRSAASLATFLKNNNEQRDINTETDFQNNRKQTSSSVGLEQLAKAENKFWPALPMTKVIDHFKIMTEKKSKNSKPFLTNDQFISFIKRGFLNDKTESKQKINFAYGEKGLVISRFYQFFELITNTDYGFSQKEKQKIVTLILNCFSNSDFTKNSISELVKPNKSKKQW